MPVKGLREGGILDPPSSFNISWNYSDISLVAITPLDFFVYQVYKIFDQSACCEKEDKKGHRDKLEQVTLKGYRKLV